MHMHITSGCEYYEIRCFEILILEIADVDFSPNPGQGAIAACIVHRASSINHQRTNTYQHPESRSLAALHDIRSTAVLTKVIFMCQGPASGRPVAA
jgi:hypothetical protein